MTTFTWQLHLTFPSQLHLLLDDAEIKGFSHVISWLEGGTMFKVHKTKEFADRIMPGYFKNQTQYKSFQRQLNSYRFHRFDAGNNKGACFHELFVRDKPALCTHMNRVKVTRGRPGVAQKQTLLLDDHAPSSPKAFQLLSSTSIESSEADVPDNFLRMFNSTEVDPLECPSVTIFDDEEEDVQLGRTSSATTCTHALQQEDMGDVSEFQYKSKSLVSLFDGEPQKTKSDNALVTQYVQFPGRNKNFDYSSLSCASNKNESSKNNSTTFDGAPSVRGVPQGWHFRTQSASPRENKEAAMNSTMGTVIFDGAAQTLHFMENFEFEKFDTGNQYGDGEGDLFSQKYYE
jgi:hypothetical protein